MSPSRNAVGGSILVLDDVGTQWHQTTLFAGELITTSGILVAPALAGLAPGSSQSQKLQVGIISPFSICSEKVSDLSEVTPLGPRPPVSYTRAGATLHPT